MYDSARRAVTVLARSFTRLEDTGPRSTLGHMSRIGFVARRLPLAIESAVALTIASVVVATRAQSKTTRLLGRPHTDTTDPAQLAPVPPRAVRIGRAVERTAAVLPWHPLCLPTAVATVWLLRRRRIPCE